MKNKPVYMYQCVICKKNMYTSNTVLKHCGKLTQWISGTIGKGVDRDSPRVRIEVTGFVEIPRENLDVVLRLDDPHRGLVDCLHFGYVKSKGLEFEIPEE